MYYEQHWFICCNERQDGKPCCGQHQTLPLVEYAKKQLKSQDSFGPGKIRVTRSGCLGRCEDGPWMVIYPEGKWIKIDSQEAIDHEISLALKENGR